MNIEKISSLHDDWTHPYINKHELPRVGSVPVIERLRMFGITDDDLAEKNIASLNEMTEDQYNALMSDVARRQYDTFLPSIYDRWVERDLEAQKAVIKRVARMYERWGINLIRHGGDIRKDEPNMVISLEGADAVRSVTDVDELYAYGVRSVILQYNRDNALGDGNGLTPLGEDVVKKMLSLGMIADLAHCNPAVRRDIRIIADTYGKGACVAYTHGAPAKDIKKDLQYGSIAESRGLSDKEVRELIQQGGIIGLGISRPFTQNIDHLAERIDDLCQLERGPQSIGIGSDFGGIDQALTYGIETPADVVKLGEVLYQRFGFREQDIANIFRHNVHQWVKKVL